MHLKITPRKKKNKIYYNAALVESFWNKSKKYSEHKVIRNLGSVNKEEAEKLKLIYSKNPRIQEALKSVKAEIKIKSGLKYDIGDCYLVNEIWEHWKISELIEKHASKKFDTPVSQILKILVLNRLLYPCSEHQISNWYDKLTGLKWIELIKSNKLYYRRLYRYTSELNKIFPDLMKDLYRKIIKIIHKNKALKKIYYDITSTYFEGSKICVLAQFGYSRDKRRDKKQIILCVITDEYGFPIYVEVLPGNITDKTTISRITKIMKEDYGLKKCVIIGDRGMISNDNFDEIKANNLDYLMALDRTHYKNIFEKQPTDINKMKDNDIKIIEKDKKFIFVKFNEQKKNEETGIRKTKVQKVKERLTFLKLKYDKKHKNYSSYEEIMYWIGKLNSKYACKRFYEINYNKKNKILKFKILNNVIKEEEQWDGYIVIQSSDKKLIDKNTLTVYKNLIKVETAFKYLKSDLDIRPIYHINADTIKGHIYICIIAYLIENYISWILKHKNNIKTNPMSILKELASIALVEKKIDGNIINFEITECSETNKIILDCFNLSVSKLEKNIGKNFGKNISDYF